MFQIDSNLASVIADLESARGKISTAPGRIMNPDQYLPMLKSSAETILQGLTTEAEKPAIPNIVSSVVGYAQHAGMIFEMSAASGFNASKPLTDEQINQLSPYILEWVANYKDKTSERDTYTGGRTRKPGEWQSNEVIAARITAVLKQEPEPWLQEGTAGKGLENPDGLISFLREKHPEVFGSDSGLTPLGESRSSELILAVLEFWHTELGVAVESALIAEINKALK